MKKYLRCICIVIIFSPILLTAQIDSGYVDVFAGELFYRVYGQGEPMVFLNGGPGFSSQGYEMYAETFASEKRRVILFDQRGTGKSEIGKVDKKRINIKMMIDDLEKLRVHLKIEKWDVMGHSFGGHYAMFYVAKFPEKIRKLILSASPNIESWSSWSQRFKYPSYDKMTTEEQELFMELSKEKARSKPNPSIIYRLELGLKSRFYVYKPENYIKAMRWFIYKCDPHPSLSSLVNGSISKPKYLKKLKKFQSPVLIIHGISDFINVSAPIANNKMFPNSELKIIYDSGHMMLIDQPEEYKNKIEAFLDKE